MKKVRLIKLIVLPVAVIDDGENLTEIEIEQMIVPSNSINKFVETDLKESLELLKKKFEED